MKIEEFLRLEGVQKSSGGWIAWCPAHGDSNPSLSVSESGNRILVHCHAGCKPDEIVAAMGLKMKDLFTDSNGRGDAPNPDIADWKFASGEDREKLCEWVSKAAIGEKPLPLIIVGPKASGKSRLLRAIGRIIGSCNVMLPPRGVREEYELWAALQSSSYVGIDDCWERNSEKIENWLQEITLGKGYRYRVPYTTDKIGEFKANAALAVAVCAKSEDRVVAIKNNYPHLRPLTLVRLAV